MKTNCQSSPLRIAIPALKIESIPNYLSGLQKLGAEPVMVTEPCNPADFDGLLLPGGGDINPSCYGQEMKGSCPPDDALDALQFAVCRAFFGAGKPILGICRGHQLLNVFFGGTLIQDLPRADDHRRAPGITGEIVHAVEAEPGSWMEQLYGPVFLTNTSHHQGVDLPGKGLKIVLRDMCGVPEALVHESLPVWGVQWHPERTGFQFLRPGVADGSKVLQFFLDACGKR